MALTGAIPGGTARAPANKAGVDASSVGSVALANVVAAVTPATSRLHPVISVRINK